MVVTTWGRDGGWDIVAASDPIVRKELRLPRSTNYKQSFSPLGFSDIGITHLRFVLLLPLHIRYMRRQADARVSLEGSNME